MYIEAVMIKCLCKVDFLNAKLFIVVGKCTYLYFNVLMYQKLGSIKIKLFYWNIHHLIYMISFREIDNNFVRNNSQISN